MVLLYNCDSLCTCLNFSFPLKKERITPSPFSLCHMSNSVVFLHSLAFPYIYHRYVVDWICISLFGVRVIKSRAIHTPGKPCATELYPQSCSTEAASFVLMLKSRLALNAQCFHCPNIWDNRTAALVLDGFVYVQYYDLFFWQWLLSSFFIYLVPVIW